MADDAGALLVRSGLVSASALEDARSRVAAIGGTVGEQLVFGGILGDDALTDFYRSRLLVPQVNPNTLARLSAKVVATIPTDMAVELRAIPVSLDNDNNLTVAMSDPSDRHAVDEIAFFTGAYVVRAVATQMQIAWCLAHYYGHVTALGQRLLHPSETPEAPSRPTPPPRAKGLTGKVEASRHRVLAPITKPVEVQRPPSGLLEPPVQAADEPVRSPEDGAPDQPRARSVSGEIRVPRQRAASIKPPLPPDDEESGPVITLEVDSDDDETGPRTIAPPPKRRQVKSDPPELAARAGEVDVSSGSARRPVDTGPRILINQEDEDEDEPILPAVSGEFRAISHRDDSAIPMSTIEVSDEASAGVVIHDRFYDPEESKPILLERRRGSPPPPIGDQDPTTITNRAPSNDEPEPEPEPEPDDEVVVLDEARKKKPSSPPAGTPTAKGMVPAPPIVAKPSIGAAPRSDRRTKMGVAVPTTTRSHRDTEEAPGIPEEYDDRPTTAEANNDDDDASDGTPTDEMAATQPSPDDDTNPHILAPPPRPARMVASQRPPSDDGDDDGRITGVITSRDLEPPARSAETSRQIDYDPIDDGWGPPGTTIPPPLLGAIPGSEDDVAHGAIPMPNMDSAPLLVGPPSPPEPTRSNPHITLDKSGQSLVQALELATSRAIDLIRLLEHARDRDEVVAAMIAHLAETHRRAGFFSIKTSPTKVTEISLFQMMPKPPSLAAATLRLDRPSTLQDVVGTRLPYRGPMHDDASRTFMTSVLGACPPEVLLVPVAIRERVVGVLFGEHRMSHTFDDQLAMAARAAGMALERILKAKRS